MKIKRVLLIACVLLAIGAAVMLALPDKGDQGPAVEYPVISAEELSADEFAQALAAYSENPILNGIKTTIDMPEGDHPRYYAVAIADEGYSDALPIDQTIYFAAGEDNQIIPKSCFTVTAPKDRSSRKLQYLNTIIGVMNFSQDGNDVLISLRVNTVFNSRGSHTYEYESVVIVHLPDLELVSYTRIDPPEEA